MDKTTDADGRYIANFIVGKLSTKPFLLCCEKLDKCNHKTICQLFNNAMGVLWPNGIIHNNVLLLLTDAAPYMVKAGKVLDTFYPRMVHLTCLVHGFHRVAETIRFQFSAVDSLISNVKKNIFKSAKSYTNI